MSSTSAGIVLLKSVTRLHIPQGSAGPIASRNPVRFLSIPAGRLVAISPFQLHHDPRFFQHPEVFNPMRHRRHGFLGQQFGPDVQIPKVEGGNLRVSGSGCSTKDATAGDGTRLRVAFGAGPFRCPGRALAMAEAVFAVGIFFACFDAALPDMSESDSAPHTNTAGASGPSTDCRTRPSGGKSGHTHFKSAEFTTKNRDTSHKCPSGRPNGHRVDQPNKPPWWLNRNAVPGAHIVARGVCSGDPGGRLPSFEPRLLVGVKKPISALWATCRTASFVDPEVDCGCVSPR